MDEIDLERALNLLIHDLRAPLSVAQGYVRLLTEDRLPSLEERRRALAQTMEALGRISRLCDDAAAYIAPRSADPAPPRVVDMRRVIEYVRESSVATCANRLSFTVQPDGLRGVFRTANTERVAQSVAVILCSIGRAAKGVVDVSVIERDGEAQFLLGHNDDRTALVSRPPEPFNPWRGGHGIALPSACRTVTEAGGRIWTFAEARGAVGIALAQEASVQ